MYERPPRVVKIASSRSVEQGRCGQGIVRHFGAAGRSRRSLRERGMVVDFLRQIDRFLDRKDARKKTK